MGKTANKKKSGKTTAKNMDPKNTGDMSGGGTKVSKMYSPKDTGDTPSWPTSNRKRMR